MIPKCFDRTAQCVVIRGKHVRAPECSSSRLPSLPSYFVMKPSSVSRLAESAEFCHMGTVPQELMQRVNKRRHVSH